jgi:hypothetical protein
MHRIAALLFITSVTGGAGLARVSEARAACPLTAELRTAPDLSGTYVLDKKHSDDPGHALDEATQSMRRFKRNAVRKRMGDALKPADTLQIAVNGDTIALSTSGRLHLTTVPGAEAKSRTGEHGGSVQLASLWEGDTLVVKTTSDRFQREARYSLEPDGASIRVAITMSGGASSEPIRYALIYRRSSTTSNAT